MSTNFAELILGADTRGLLKGKDALEATTKAGIKTERAVGGTEKGFVRAGRGAGIAAKQVDGFSTSVDRTRGIALAATRVLVGMTGAFLSANAIGRASQTYASIGNSLRAMGVEAESVAGQIDAIGDIAKRTRAPMEATAQLYQRISIAGKDLGASQKDVLRFTENVGLALAQQGGSAAQASGALLQLSQAMAGGVVRAEEFNSILEGAFPIAQAAANAVDGAAGSVGKLRNMVVEGEISSREFFDAILSSSEALEAAFGNTVPTISQAVSVLGTSFTLMVGEMDAATGVSAAFANGIILLADNLDRVATYAATAAVAFGGAYVASMAAAALSTATLSGSLIFLRTALIRTGIGALVIGAGELVYQFSRLVKGAGGFGNAMSLLGDVAGAVWRGMIDSAAAIPPALNGVWERMKGGFLIALSGMATAFFDFVWTIANGLQQVPGLDLIGDQLMGVADAADAASGSLMRSGLAAQASASGSFSKAADTISTAFDPARKAVQSLSDAVSATTTEIEGGGDATSRLNNALDDTGGAGGKAAKAIEKVKTEAEAYNAALKDAAMTAEDIGTEKANILIGGIDGVANAFGDFIGRGLTDFKSFAKSILSSFTGMISQMVAMAAKNKIMIGLGIGGTSGGASLTGGLGGIGDLFKGGSIFGKTGIFGTMGSSLGTGLGGLIGGQGSALATSLGSLGGAIGAALPVIGIAAAAFSFFKTKTTELNAGLRVTTDGLSAMVDTFKTLEKVKFWGLSKKISTTYEMAAADIASPIQSAITSIGETVLGLSDTLGLASDNLQNTSFEFEVSTKGKSDAEIQAAITAEMTRLGNSFADAVIGSYTEYLPDEAEIARLDKRLASMPSLEGGRMFTGADSRVSLEAQKVAAQTAIEVTHLNGALAGLQREGEGSLAMLERIVGNLHGVNQSLHLFDRAALELGIEGAKAATALVDLSGGLEAFANNTQFVFENMMTSAAQEMRLTEIAAEKLNSGLGALGIAIPQTHAEFMEMLNGQDLMTEAGRNTHAALLDVAQAFVQVNGTAQAAADAIAAQSAAAAQAAQNARAADVSAGMAVAKARADAANAAMADADAMLRAAFAAERQRLSGSQTTSIDTSSISARVGLFNTIRDALERAYTDRRVLTALGQKMRLTDATAFLRSAVSSGGTSDVDRLEAALDAVADPSTALFKSFADYQHDYNVNTNLIERLKGLTDDSLSVEEKTLRSMESQSSILQSNNASQLAALDAQMNALLGIDNSVLSLGDAIAGFQSAKDAVSKAVDAAAPASTQFAAGSFGAKLDAIYMAELGRGVKQAGLDFYGGHYVNGLSLEDIHRDIMGSAEAAQYAATGIPAFASGGYHTGGVRLVGENGPELEVTGPSRIYSAPQTRNMLGGGNSDVVAEIRALRAANAEISAELRQIRRFAQSRTDIVEDQRAEELAAGGA